METNKKKKENSKTDKSDTNDGDDYENNSSKSSKNQKNSINILFPWSSLKDFQEKSRKNMKKLQEDFNRIFGIKPKQNSRLSSNEKKKAILISGYDDGIINNQTSKSSTNNDFIDSNESIEYSEINDKKKELTSGFKEEISEEIPKERSLVGNQIGSKPILNISTDKFLNQWNTFQDHVHSWSRAMQQQWDESWNRFQRNIKQKNEETKKFLDTTNKTMANFFKEQNQRAAEFFSKMESDLREKSKQNKRAFFNAMMQAGDNWNRFLHNQQKQLEKNLSQINRWSWQNQIRFILYAIPIFIVVVLIFAMIRPFIM